jgi:hypothetical protein
MTALKTKLEATKAKVEAQDINGLTKDDLLGDLLYTIALSFHAELEVINFIDAKMLGVTAVTLPSETIFSYELKVNSFWGSPLSASPGGLAMDADRLITLVKALDGNPKKPKQFMLLTGMKSSFLEHSIPEQGFSTLSNQTEGISAVKALQIANSQGIPIYTINKTNINLILPQLQLDSGTISDIKNAVNAGKIVFVSKRDITFNGWTGCGYIIIDPTTGAGAYMISGGMNGSWYPQNGWEWYSVFFAAIAGPIIAAALATLLIWGLVALIPLIISFIISVVIPALYLVSALTFLTWQVLITEIFISCIISSVEIWNDMTPDPNPIPDTQDIPFLIGVMTILIMTNTCIPR